MSDKPVTQTDLFNLLDLIRPWQMTSDSKIRIGADADGGYVMPSVSLKSNLVLSVGIGDQVTFDDELASRGARVYQFDHTIAATPSIDAKCIWQRLGWAANDGGEFLSLHSMVESMDWTDAQHPIFKFDTEGAEWQCLPGARQEDLARFEVLTGEFHGFQQLVNRQLYDIAYYTFRKLAETHRCIHLHGNNSGGMVMLGGLPFPRVFELTYIRRDAASFYGHSNEPIPGPLDRPNNPALPDLYLRAI